MIDYLYEHLGLKCDLSGWKTFNELPMFLKSKIKYYVLNIEHIECILMKIEATDYKVSMLMNNVMQLAKYTEKPIVLWLDSITTYQRRALIRNHISFIVPGSQLYLPFAGMSFKEHIMSERRRVEKLSPMGQFVLLYIIYNKSEKHIYQNQITVDLKASPMNVSRAVKELVSLGLVYTEIRGKYNLLKPVSTGRDFYEMCKKYLQSPIQKTIYVEPDYAYLELPLAGESALSVRTELNPPKHRCVAIDRRQKEKVEKEKKLDIDVLMPGTDYMEVQLWKYNPKFFSDENGVDIISLAESLNNCIDERVEAAVEKMLEGYKW